MKKVGEDVIAKLKRGSELAFEELFKIGRASCRERV